MQKKKKKLNFIIPTFKQRERKEHEDAMREEYKNAELEGYRPIWERL